MAARELPIADRRISNGMFARFTRLKQSLPAIALNDKVGERNEAER